MKLHFEWVSAESILVPLLQKEHLFFFLLGYDLRVQEVK